MRNRSVTAPAMAGSAHLRMGIARLLLAAVLFACLAGNALAQTPPTPRIGVVTMGPGDIFWERFGHDAIVVDDPAQPGPVSYNFGFFDLQEDGFAQRFAKGEMRYLLVALPLEEDLAYYREVGRGASLQWLDLEPAQARRLAADLAENARPENARYRYDYYTDNCATRVRDALDRALDGRLRRQLEGRSSGDTYRSESLRLAAPAPLMWLGFDIAIGPFGDRALTRWEQGFLPRRLADDLRKVTRADGRPLVAAEIELLPQGQTAEPVEQALPLWPWLLVGASLALLVLGLGRRYPRTLAGLVGGFWLLCGLLGAVLALSWAFTEHRALWANRNLLLMNPLCLLLLPGAWALLRGRLPSPRFRALLLAVAVLAALACLPLWLQAVPQRNGHWIALLLPLHLAFARLWSRPVRA